jgi:hypothetical protein
MTCCVLERGMMAGGEAGVEEIDKTALRAKTGTLVEVPIREDEVGEVKLTLMPAAVAAEESIGEAGEVG